MTSITREFLATCSEVINFDKEGELELFSYSNCTNSASDVLKNARGIVFHNDEVVARSLPYTHEFTSDDAAAIKSLIGGGDNLQSDAVVCKAIEGTLIRMFYYDGRWYIATNRKLDAYKSKWGSSRTFGELFRTALHSAVVNSEPLLEYCDVGNNITEERLMEVFMNDILSKHRQYVFLLSSNKDNRIVNNFSAESKVFFVGYFDDKRDFVISDNKTLAPFPRAENVNITDIDALCADVATYDITKYQGAIIFTPTLHIKVYTPEYKRMSELRGNVASIKYRYLQLRSDKTKRAEFARLYPDYSESFIEYERQLSALVQRVYSDYVRRFIRHEIIRVPQDEYFIMLDCHKWHQLDREHNKISMSKVEDVINAKSAFVLNKLIRLAAELDL